MSAGSTGRTCRAQRDGFECTNRAGHTGNHVTRVNGARVKMWRRAGATAASPAFDERIATTAPYRVPESERPHTLAVNLSIVCPAMGPKGGNVKGELDGARIMCRGCGAEVTHLFAPMVPAGGAR